MLNKFIRNFIAKRVAGRTDDGIMITLSDPKKVDFQAAMLEDLLMRNGFNPADITSERQLKNILNQIDAIQKQSTTTSGIRNTESAKIFEIDTGKEIPKGSKIMGGQAVDDMPPPGSRGGSDDIAAPVQSQEETLKNMTEAEIKREIEQNNKSAIEKILKRKNREDVYSLDDYDTTNMSEIKKEIIRTETKLGNLNPNTPDFRERAKPLIDKIEALKNKMRDDKAGGGRIGYKDGPKFDKEAEEIAKEIKKQKELQIFDAIASGSKTGKQQIQGAPEGFTIDEETFNAILKADIPISEKIDFLASYQYGKDRSKIEKDNQELFLGEGGFKDRNVGFGFNKDGEGIGGTLMYNLETGEPQFNIGFKKRFEDGGRVGFKDGMNRRTFLKILGGAMSIPIIGKIFKPLKVGKTITKVPIIKTDNVAGKPEWFDQLVNKVILEGDDVTKRFATKDREIVHMKKLDEDTTVRVTEDMDEGAIRVEYESPENVYGDPVQMQYKKPKPDEGDPRPSAEFDTAESGPVGRSFGPDDYEIEIDEVGGTSISDLTSDVSKLKEYATGKKQTLKEFVQSKKRKDRAKAISEGGENEMDEVVRRQGEFIQFEDIDPNMASGGIARMLGE